MMKESRENIQNYLKCMIERIWDDDYSVATDIDLESNMTKNTELSTSTLVARQLTDNPDEMIYV